MNGPGLGAPSPNLAEQLVVAEYQSLRQESDQARNAQQTILNWSMGAYALLVAAGISVLDDGGKLPVGVSLLFALGVPGFITAAALIWIGESARMERVGFFLRRWEREHWQADASEKLAGPVWENYLSFDPKKSFGKQWSGYLGGALLYAGGLAVSLALFFATSGDVLDIGGRFSWVTAHPLNTVIIVSTLFVGACLFFGIPVIRLGRKLAPKESLRPTHYKHR